MNLHVSIVLVCLCGVAYRLLVKINVRAVHANFSCSCLQTHEVIKNIREELQNTRVLLTCLKLELSYTIGKVIATGT